MKVKRKVGRQETKLEGKDKESKSIKVRCFYIGAGGLGHLIAIGIALSNAHILITGGILTALMAIAADFVMGHIEERLVPPAI